MKAFPHIAKVHMLDGNSIIKEEITSGGMELRDYFAAKAMQAVAVRHSHERDVARNAYKIAEAMMEARKENK